MWRRQALCDLRRLDYVGRQGIKVAPCLEEERIGPPAIVDFAQPACAEMLFDHRSGQAGDAEPVEGHLKANGIVGGGHDADLGVPAAKMIIQLAMGDGAAGMGEDRVVRKVVRQDLAGRKPERRRGHPRIGRLPQLRGKSGLAVERTALKCQIKIVRGERLGEIGREIDRQLDVDVRKPRPHLDQERLKPSVGDKLADAEPEDPAIERVVICRSDEGLVGGKDCTGGGDKALAARRQADRSRIALHQAKAELLLKLGDPTRDVRLGRVQPLCRSAEGSEVGDCDEGLNMLEVGRHGARVARRPRKEKGGRRARRFLAFDSAFPEARDEVSLGDLAPLRKAAAASGSAGLLGAYGGKSVPTAIETVEASVLMPSLGGSADISLRHTSEFGSAEINWGFSWLSDQGGPLSIGGPKGPGASNVASLDLGIGGEVAPGTYVSINAQAAIVTPSAPALFNEISHITFDSLSATLQLASVGCKSDLLSLTVAAPPSVNFGTAQTTLPMVLSEGGIGYEDMTLNLAPQSRQIDLGVTYQRPLSENAELYLGAYGSENLSGGIGSNFSAVFAVQFQS